MKTQEDRFWSFVNKTDGCWLWTGSTNRKGYGQMSQGRRGLRPLHAHRLSWMIHFGEISSGMCVLHRCDNPPCVRPDHLFLGTIADNDADRDAKGRTMRGSNHTFAKLSDTMVAVAREMYWVKKILVKDIAVQLGVTTPGALHQAIAGRTWKHLPMPAGIDTSKPWSSGSKGALISRIERSIAEL